jgi:hypothetical protein
MARLTDFHRQHSCCTTRCSSGAGRQQPAAHAELDVVGAFGVGIMQPPSGFAGVDLQQGFEGQARQAIILGPFFGSD